MPFGLDPLIFGLIVGLVLGAVIEILIVLGPGRYFIAKKARKENLASLEAGEWDPALERVLEPLKEQISEEMTAMKAGLGEVPDLSQELEDFEARFTTAYTEDMVAIKEEMEKIPLRVSGTIHGREGVESKAVQLMMDEQGGEVTAAENMMAAVASEDPEIILATAMRKVVEWAPSKKYAAENPGKMLAYEMGKPFLVDGMMRAYESLTGRRVGGAPGVPQLASGKRGNATNPYGL